MKRYLLSALAVAVALAFALPARAEGEKKVEKPKKHEFTGEITKLDVAGKSVTLKNNKGDEKMFAVADKAKVSVKDKEVAELGDLKVGDKVTLHYTEEAGKNIAHKIGLPDSAKKEKKAEEKKAETAK